LVMCDRWHFLYLLLYISDS